MNMSGAYQNPIYNQQMQQYGQQYAYNPYMNQPRIDNTQNYMQAPQQIQQQIERQPRTEAGKDADQHLAGQQHRQPIRHFYGHQFFRPRR